MPDNSSSNKRMAKNTVILYVKLIISILINFVSARILLDALGASDYGLYNVVGGIVALFNIMGTSMSVTSYRYMVVEIGRGEKGTPNKMYNTIFVVHIVLALLLFFVGETLGVYYVNHYLNVSQDRITDALFVLHFSLIATCVSILSIPANGLIVARERFLFTSVLTLITDALKLGVVLLIMIMTGNRLRMYVALLTIVHAITPMAYHIYCQYFDKDIVHWKINKTWKDYKELFAFAWWIFIGAFSSVAKTQGAAMIINFFFGTVLNAAFGIANQIYNATSQFTTTLRQAAIPQIMKGQASGDDERSLNLVYKISKYSYLFMIIPAIPLIICIKGTLFIWLGTPPEYTDVFIVLMLVNGMVANLNAGFDASIQASGSIRKNQIGYCLINLSLLPIIYILYKLGMPPYINVVTMIFISSVFLIFQCWIMKKISEFSIYKYIKVTILPTFTATLLATCPLLFIYNWANRSISNTIIAAFICVFWTILSIYFWGFSRSEKDILANLVIKKLLRTKRLEND